MQKREFLYSLARLAGQAIVATLVISFVSTSFADDKRPNIVVIMSDDVGWGDLGSYGGGITRGAPTPHLDRLAQEGMRFTNWYGQASCTAGRASFMTGRIPIRSALSLVLGPGSTNYLRRQTPTIAESFKKNGYQTYMSGKWHLGDTRESFPIHHGFDKMKHMLCYYAGVYAYTDPELHEDFPRDDPVFMELYNHVVNRSEWKGVASRPATITKEYFDYDDLALIDNRQRESAIEYIRRHADDEQPFFMYVAFMKCHNPNNPAPAFKGKSKESHYLDALMELDHNSGMIVEAIRELGLDENTIVVWTTDNGPWIDAWPDAGYTPFRAMKGTSFEGGWRVPAIMWWPGHIEAGRVGHGITSHIDLWATLAAMVGLEPPPHGPWQDNNGNPIWYDGVDNSEYILNRSRLSGRSGTALVPRQSKREEWIYIHDLEFGAVRWRQWKFVFTAKDTWLGPSLKLTIPAVFNLRQDPGEHYDMFFNGAAPKAAGVIGTSPGRFAGNDNAWTLLWANVIVDGFTDTLKNFPNIETTPGGAALGADVPAFTLPPLEQGKPPHGDGP
jgi:arylsulfatase